MDKQVIEQSIIDIKQPVEELLEFAKYLQNELIKWENRLGNASYLTNETRTLAFNHYGNIYKGISSVSQELKAFKIKLNSLRINYINCNTLDELIRQKKDIFIKLRMHSSLFASILTFLNWQSPSIKSSQSTRVGIEKYPIKGDYNDYKRDRSGDVIFCEELFGKRLFYTKNTTVKPILNLTNGGMAAFTSVLYFLIGENIVKDKILASADIYVENTLLLKKFFKTQLETFDYNDTNLIIDKIITEKPSVIFLDPISNSVNIPLFDVSSIIRMVAKIYKEKIYFVVDVTCNIGYENILDDFIIPDNIKVILHGTLLKASQLGMEKVYAGFVLSFGLDKFVSKILEYRTLSGTSIQDFGVYLLPVTTRELLRSRLRIIERNTINLANFLIKIDPGNKIFKEIIYPGVKSHKDFDKVGKIGFAGPFFNIKFHSKFNNDEYFEFFTNEIIECAKKYNCDIVHGASYGFNELSLYYSVGWDSPKDHYLRLSVGTETTYEMEKIKKVFSKVFKNFKKRIITD